MPSAQPPNLLSTLPCLRPFSEFGGPTQCLAARKIGHRLFECTSRVHFSDVRQVVARETPICVLDGPTIEIAGTVNETKAPCRSRTAYTEIITTKRVIGPSDASLPRHGRRHPSARKRFLMVSPARRTPARCDDGGRVALPEIVVAPFGQARSREMARHAERRGRGEDACNAALSKERRRCRRSPRTSTPEAVERRESTDNRVTAKVSGESTHHTRVSATGA
jgi:hypothetical protein